MPLRIKCPTGHTLIVPDDRAGRTLKCPRCDQPVVVPAGEADIASQALLSVLAEGIPAANLAAGSLRVAAGPAPPTPGSLQVDHPRLDRPGAGFKTAPQLPVARPKSRVLPTPPREPVARLAVPNETKPQQQTEPKSPEPQVSELAAGEFHPIPPAAEPVAQSAPAPAAGEAARREKSPGLDEAIIHDVAPPPEIEPLPERAIPPAVEPDLPQPTEPQPVSESNSIAASVPATPEPTSEPEPNRVPLPLGELPQPAIELAPPSGPTESEPLPAAPLLVSDERDETHWAPPHVDDHPEPPPFVPVLVAPAPANLAADAARTLATYQLAIALAAAALFSVVPAVWDVVEFLRSVESVFVARWAMAIFFLGVLQLAYAVYLFQLPDWSSVWVVTLVSLGLAAVYAAVLGLVLISPPDGFLVGPSGLQLADKLAGGKAALWCLCMISVSTILAFFAGRLGASWYRAELMLRLAAV